MGQEEQTISALERLVRFGADEDIKRFFVLLRPPELADLIERLTDDDRMRVIRLMGAPLASEVLREVQESERDDILEDLTPEKRAEIVHESMSDDAADLIASLPDKDAKETLEHLDEEERKEIKELLEYGEETAGGLMQTELVRVRDNLTVAGAIDRVRAANEEDVGEIHEVYLVNAEGHLVGCVSPADLLHAEPDAPVTSVCDLNPVSVPVDLDQEKIAEIARENDLAAVPVVDSSGTLLGQVLHDDIADVIQEEATEDMARMAGADPIEIYVPDSVFVSVKSRAPWLIPAFAGGLLASLIIEEMETALSTATLLAAFLPVVIGMAGNVGTQASVITVRSIAVGRIDITRGAFRILVREGMTGIVLGSIFGALLFFYTVIFKADVDRVRVYAFTLGLAIFISMSVGTVLGVVVPLTLNRFGIDPATATTPFVQTTNDVIGVGLLFLVASLVGLI